MTVNNPLDDRAPTEQEDENLVLRARAGDRKALEDLIERHQAWIYNLALRMLFHPQDAENATQEILVKVLTRLSSFEGRSSFRTWLYRVVFNHLLNVKRGREELKITTFSAYGDALDSTPDLELADPKDGSPETNLLVTEVNLAYLGYAALPGSRATSHLHPRRDLQRKRFRGRRCTGDNRREFSSTVGSRSARLAQLHERQVRLGEFRESVPMRQEDPRFHSGGPRRS